MKQSPNYQLTVQNYCINEVKVLSAKLDDLKMCMDLINRHYQALHRTLVDLEAN